MFEIIARDQGKLTAFYHKVFGWQFERGTEGFAYVHFDVPGAAALGGIGQADPSIPGYAAGSSFYLLVDDLPGTIAAAAAAGGRCTMPPAAADGYEFAMIADPEENIIGLLKTPQDGAVSLPPGRVP
jgi:predicted enzyme related to lactoylglutathione lyase